jgi:hypothetical protein
MKVGPLSAGASPGFWRFATGRRRRSHSCDVRGIASASAKLHGRRDIGIAEQLGGEVLDRWSYQLLGGAQRAHEHRCIECIGGLLRQANIELTLTRDF